MGLRERGDLELWSLVGYCSFTGTGAHDMYEGSGCSTMELIDDNDHLASRLDAHASRLTGHPVSWCQMV